MKIPKKKWYVTMTDKFLSGWGMSAGKTNKLIIGCDTLTQAKTAYKNAKKMKQMKYVNYTSTKPYYDKRRYYISYKNYKNSGRLFTK